MSGPSVTWATKSWPSGVEAVKARRRSGLRPCGELVADAVARVDEVMARRSAIDLLPELADEDVDRPIAIRLPPAPDALQQLVTRKDPAGLERERVQEPELGP